MAGYTATQNADSTWNVLDVPVFGPLPAGARKNPEPIDRAWMLKAVERSKLREAERYFGPLHVRHTGDDAPKIPAGKFRLTRVGKYVYEGESVDVTFADYLSMPADVYARLNRGELHFRSVEVFDWAVPEINAIAMLEADVPFFRLGWAGIEREFPNPGTAADFTPYRTDASLASPAVAFAAVGAGGVALFRFADDGEGDGKKCPTCGRSKSDEDDDQPKEKQMPPVDKKDDKDHGAEMTALTVDLTTLRASVDKLVGEKGDLIAKLSVLEAKDRERETAKTVEGFVAKARTDLAGYNFSAIVEAQVRDLAGMDKPEERVAKFVAIIKTHGLKDPPSTMDRAVGRASFESIPAEFAAYPANQLDLVRECLREHAACFGKSFNGTAKEYVDINLRGKVKALETAGK